MKILLGVDDSKYSDAALNAVIAQFQPKDVQVHVLHVLQPISYSAPPQMSADFTPELEDEAKRAHEFLERAAKTLRDSGFEVETEVAKGDVRLTVIERASQWKADLIVLGSHGRSGIPRLLLGSVAEFVARNATCSVQIVRIPERN